MLLRRMVIVIVDGAWREMEIGLILKTLRSGWVVVIRVGIVSGVDGWKN